MNANFYRIFLISLLLLASELPAQRTMGVQVYTEAAKDGYVLLSPLASNKTYLIDKCGRQVKQWSSNFLPGTACYLQNDGSLLRAGDLENGNFVSNNGRGGIIEKYNWNNQKVWSYEISDNNRVSHHDFKVLPNGNILMIVWEKKSEAEALFMGRNAASAAAGVWNERIIEIKPTGGNNATVVWEWSAWDHLVQEHDSTKPGLNRVAEHPELIDINYATGAGYNEDWLHINGIDYDEKLDMIVLSVHRFDEIWVIDHSTTTAEARGHTGGRSGQGGDLLYRWGNPAAYRNGTAADKKLFHQHDAQFLRFPGKDSVFMLVFNNGLGRPGSQYSTIDMFALPVNSGTTGFVEKTGSVWGPENLSWRYVAEAPESFYSPYISGVDMLADGSRLVCLGMSGVLIQLDNKGNTVWRYVNPVAFAGPLTQGTVPYGNQVFRAQHIAPGFPGIAGKTLTPGAEIEVDPIVPSICAGQSQLGISEPVAGKLFRVVNSAFEWNVNPSDRFARIMISDLSGRILADEQGQFSAEYSLPAGFYVLRIKDKDGNIISNKFVIHSDNE